MLSHHEIVDVTDPDRRPHILMVVANPTVSTTLGWPVGFWASELFHPYYEFTQRRYDVTITSPEGGKVGADVPVPRAPGPAARDPPLLRGAQADGRPLPRHLRAARRAALGRLLPDRRADDDRLRQRRGGLWRRGRRTD